MSSGVCIGFIPSGVLLCASAMLLSCLETFAALSPPRAMLDSDGVAVAECVAEIISANRAGAPMVGVAFAADDDAFLLPGVVLAALQRPPEEPLILLGVGERASGDPSAQASLSWNMSHIVFLPSAATPFRRLLEQAARDPHWSPATMHLVVTSTAEAAGSDGGAEAREVLSLAWRRLVANIAVVVPTKGVDEQLGARISVVTHFPYSSPGVCGTEITRTEEIAVCRGRRFIRGSPREVFPEKFSDLHGCALRATVFDAPPACIPKGKGLQTDEVLQVDGLHGLLLAEAAKRMNFTPQLFQFLPKRYGNSSNPFWNLFPPLLEHQIDMVMCEAVLTPTRHQFLGEGFHHQWSCTTFAVPISHPGSSWQLIGLASPSAWLAVLASIILSCTATWIVSKVQPLQLSPQRHHFFHAATDALVAYAGVTLQRPPTALSSRILFPAVCLGGLIVTTAIKAHLSSFLSAPDSNYWAPSSMEEMVKAHLRVGGTMAFKFLSKDMKSTAWEAVLRDYELQSEETESLDIDGMAVAGMQRNLLYKLSKKNRDRTLLKGCPLPLPTVIFLCKASPFQLELRKIDRALVSGGIINKWMHDHTTMSTSIRSPQTSAKATIKRKINVSDMNGVFVIYSLGLLASLVTLISEVLVFKLCSQ